MFLAYLLLPLLLMLLYWTVRFVRRKIFKTAGDEGSEGEA
jgi:hypothetical protein